MFNSAMDDIAAAMNVPWPVAIGIGVAGATGSWDSINAQGTDIVAAAAINLTTATGPNLNLTGNTNVSTVTLAAGAVRFVTATGTGQLVASANLVVNGSTTTNYTLTGTELLIFVGRSGSVVKVWAIGGGSVDSGWQNTNTPINLSLVASVAGNALTVAIKGHDGNDPSASNKVYIPFRNATAASGDVDVLTLTAATSLVVSSGSTLGMTSAVAATLAIVGINDGGTFRLGIINPLARPLLDGIASSTAEGGAGAADSAGVIYTGTATASKAMTVLGYATVTEATAGTWATAPSTLKVASGPEVNNVVPQITPWVAYTPTFTGFGTPSGVSIFSRRVGDTLEVMGKFTAGTSTAVEARMTLGFNGVDGGLTVDSTKVPNIRVAGMGVIGVAADFVFTYLIEPGAAYICFGLQDVGLSGLTKLNGSSVLSGNTASFNFHVPITGW